MKRDGIGGGCTARRERTERTLIGRIDSMNAVVDQSEAILARAQHRANAGNSHAERLLGGFRADRKALYFDAVEFEREVHGHSRLLRASRERQAEGSTGVGKRQRSH